MLVFMSVPFLIWLFLIQIFAAMGLDDGISGYKTEQKFLGSRSGSALINSNCFFTMKGLYAYLRNTLAQSGINLVLGFVTAITLALLLRRIASYYCLSASYRR